ncbi:MAG: hypothetical protein H6834_16565 [Planctomycetes bacterium]|nr:hypothetical protein [Planctomycetota bacterium]
MKLCLKTFAVLFLAGCSFTTGSLLAQEGAGETPADPAVTTPAVEPPVQVKVLVGDERFLYPGFELGTVRVAIAMLMGEGAPNFSQDMLGAKALSWVDAEGAAHPVEDGGIQAGTAPLPKGTFLRNVVEIPGPKFDVAATNFKLRWSAPGIESVDVEFLHPRQLAEGETADLRTMPREQLDRTLLRVHFATVGNDGETRTETGSLLYRLEAPKSDLNLKAMREFLFHAVESKYYDGMPVYNLNPAVGLQTGERLPIRRTDPYPKVGQWGLEAVPGAEYGAGDLVLVATPWAAANSPTVSKNLWRGQVLVPFKAVRPKAEGGPLSVRVGRLLQDGGLLEVLAKVETVKDDITGLQQPIELLVVDHVEVLSF